MHTTRQNQPHSHFNFIPKVTIKKTNTCHVPCTQNYKFLLPHRWFDITCFVVHVYKMYLPYLLYSTTFEGIHYLDYLDLEGTLHVCNVLNVL